MKVFLRTLYTFSILV